VKERVSGWIEANVSRPVDNAVESTVDCATEKAEQAKKAAQEAAAAVEKKARQAIDSLGSAWGKYGW